MFFRGKEALVQLFVRWWHNNPPKVSTRAIRSLLDRVLEVPANALESTVSVPTDLLCLRSELGMTGVTLGIWKVVHRPPNDLQLAVSGLQVARFLQHPLCLYYWALHKQRGLPQDVARLIANQAGATIGCRFSMKLGYDFQPDKRLADPIVRALCDGMSAVVNQRLQADFRAMVERVLRLESTAKSVTLHAYLHYDNSEFELAAAVAGAGHTFWLWRRVRIHIQKCMGLLGVSFAVDCAGVARYRQAPLCLYYWALYKQVGLPRDLAIFIANRAGADLGCRVSLGFSSMKRRAAGAGAAEN